MNKHRIIDAHCHIFPEKIAEKATKSTDAFYGITASGLAHSSAFTGNVQTLLKQCEENNIEKCVINSVATSPTQVEKINRFIMQEVKLHPDKFIGLGAMHPDSDDFQRDASQIINLKLQGVKLHPDIQNFKIDSPDALEIFKVCREKGLPVLVHTGDSRFDNSNPDRVVKVLEMFPDLTIIGAHLGGWSVWEEAFEKLTRFPNFYVDTSSSFYELPKKRAKEIIEAYGTKRVIFGTDFPMWKQNDDLEYLFSLGFSENELNDILYNNILNALKINE